MGSLPLQELLERMEKIPPEEFRMGIPEGEWSRPLEMALLAEIIPNDKILEIRQKKGFIITRCCDETPKRIKFQITNGETHIVILSLVENKPQVTDNRKIQNINTVEGLRKHILTLAGVE